MEQIPTSSNVHDLFPQGEATVDPVELEREAQETFAEAMAELRARNLHEGEVLMLRSTQLHNQAQFLIEHSEITEQAHHVAA